MWVVIDLHCHLLPGIDDGPPDMAQTIDLARAQVAAGVRTVACTPHVNWRTDNTGASIADVLTRTRAALAEAGVELELVAGGEVGLTRAVDMDDDELAAVHLAGGPWLLLEAPLSVVVGVETAIAHVAGRGHRVLLAHPERCPAFQRDPDALRRLVDDGVVLTQVTATALDGTFGSTVRRFAESLMRDGLVHVIASDAHHAVGRAPGLREPVEQAGFGDLVAYLTEDVPAAILAGGPLPERPMVAAARSSRRRWRDRG
jgi:protein-tyrosine phosphatase